MREEGGGGKEGKVEEERWERERERWERGRRRQDEGCCALLICAVSMWYQVRVESLYGMKTFFLLPVDFSESKEMTFPRVCRERLMLAPSCR